MSMSLCCPHPPVHKREGGRLLPTLPGLLCPEGTLPQGGEGSKVLPNVPPFLRGSPPAGLLTQLPPKAVEAKRRGHAKVTQQDNGRAQGRIQGSHCLLCACLHLKRLGAPFLRYTQEVWQHSRYPKLSHQHPIAGLPVLSPGLPQSGSSTQYAG